MGKSLNIYGQKVDIVEEDLTRANLAGYYYLESKKITICKHQDKDQKKRTLIHEFIHAVCHIQGWNQTALTNDLQELICEHFSNALCDNFDIKIKKRAPGKPKARKKK